MGAGLPLMDSRKAATGSEWESTDQELRYPHEAIGDMSSITHDDIDNTDLGRGELNTREVYY